MFTALVRWFKNLFDKRQETRSETLPHPASDVGARLNPFPDKQVRVAIIVGHTEKAKGAVAYTGESEWDWNNSVANKVVHFCKGKSDVKIFYRSPNLGYRAAMKDIAKRVSEWDADYSIELHFNALHKVAYGCEILVDSGSKDYEFLIKMCDQWTNKLAKEFDLKQRNKVRFADSTYGDGVKVLKYGERGYWNLAYLSDKGVKAILIEPMFANLKTKESERFFEGKGKEKYALFLANRINEL